MVRPRHQGLSPALLFALFGASLLWACTQAPEPEVATSLPPTESQSELIDYITAEVGPDGAPRYQGWELFPESGVGDPLGLPVHGRFTTVYANDIAHAAAQKWIGAGTLDQFVDFPDGSIIVKANTFIDPREKPDLPPGVLTAMYKPGVEGFCQTGDYWSEDGCYGGEWMFIFYEVPDGPLAKNNSRDFDNDVVTRDFCVTCHAGGSDDDYLRSLQRLRRAAQPATRPGAPSGDPTPPLGDPFCNSASLSQVLPADVDLDPTSIEDPGQRQRMFDCLSWRTFIALNWPVSADERGQPDNGASLWSPELDGYVADSATTDPADFHPRERVWETYKEVYELFQTGSGRFDWDPSTAEPPLAWNDSPPNPVGEGCDAVDGGKVLMMAHKNRTPLPSTSGAPPPRPGEGVINESV